MGNKLSALTNRKKKNEVQQIQVENPSEKISPLEYAAPKLEVPSMHLHPPQHQSKEPFQGSIGNSGEVNPYLNSNAARRRGSGDANSQTRGTVVALFDFSPAVEKELGFYAGDHLTVLRVEDPEWLFAQHHLSGRRGFIPSSFVAHTTALDVYQWYHGSIDRRDAESLLLREPLGNFLVRDSVSKPGDYALSVKWQKDDGSPIVKHFVIQYINYKYNIWKLKYFGNLNELIEEYKVACQGLPVKLANPCPKISPSIHDLRFKDEWEIDRNEISITENIGSGHFGEVYRGTWKNTLEVAIKTLKKGTMSDEKFLEEARIMKDLKHDNILNLLATCSKDEPIFIITKFMSLGSLQTLLRKAKHTKEIMFDEMIKFAYQIAKGMSYLETKKLIHRDLAARNVLVDNGYVCKIADFGLAKIIEDNPSSQSNDKFPVKWSPPEVLMSGHFNMKSDVWSYGVVLIEILTYGDDIYLGFKTKNEVKQAVLNGYRIPKPVLCPEYIYEVILKCWDANPAGRPTFNDLKTYFEDSSFNKIIDGTQYLTRPGY